MEFSLFEFLQHCTVRIQCALTNGSTSLGTGFFFNFQLQNEIQVPAIVTNKHVVEGATGGTCIITALREDGTPDYEELITVDMQEFEQALIKHPDNAIDLCIYPAAQIFHGMTEIGKRPCITLLGDNEMPDFSKLEDFKPTEEIHMIGYPIGLGDEVHNLPLVRKGITATPFYVDHNNEPVFLVDCACFPGSSGSPVLIVNEGSFSLHKKPLMAGNRMVLLGILYAGPQYNAHGELQRYNIPTQRTVVTDIPMNLGYCVNSRKLLDFLPILEMKVSNQKKENTDNLPAAERGG